MPDLFGSHVYDGLCRSAIVSPCGQYRYRLERSWRSGGNGKTVCFIMLNPSVADAFADDPTIRRCIQYAQRWGFSTLSVRNLFAYRATNPRELLTVPDPIGPENDRQILDATTADLVVCAWGAADYPTRVSRVLELLRDKRLHCLKLTRDGHPWHPLYCPGDLQPLPFIPSVRG